MTLREWKRLREEEPALLLYFYGEQCGVCRALFPKVEHLLEHEFPAIRLIAVKAEQSRELMGQVQMLSIPGLLLYLEGRETIRANGQVSLAQWQTKLRRPYDLLFPGLEEG